MKKIKQSEHSPWRRSPRSSTVTWGKHVFLLVCLHLLAYSAMAQFKVSGTVTDSKDESLVGVTVRLENSSIGGTTNEEGQYSLDIPQGTGTLIFTYVGFNNQSVSISGRNTINIAMQNNAASLKDVVIIGYGSQSKSLVTTAIAKMDSSVLKNIPFSNPGYALQGTLPGVRVTSTSGQPGASPTIVIRGGTSLDPNTSYPLYVIDGVISPDMSGLNSADIESIQVLKDAASTAIYGARGSNGVVIITTKSGHIGRTVVSYHYNLGFSHYTPNLKMLNGRDFIKYNRLALAAASVKFPAFEGILSSASSAGIGNDLTNQTLYTTQYLNDANAHKLKEGWQSMPDPLDPSKTIIFQDINWRDIMFRTAVTNDHTLSAYGGNEKATYSASLGYMDNSGVDLNTGYQRFSLNTKGDIKLRDNLKIFSQILYSTDHTKAASNESNLFGRMLQVAPTVKMRFEDGTLSQGASGGKGNPLYHESLFVGGTSVTRLTLTAGAVWNILPNLTFTPKASLLTRSIDTRSFVKSNYNALSLDVTRSASENMHNYTERQADAVFAYNKTFNNAHHLDLTGGYSYLWTEDASLGASGRGAATDLIPTLNASAIPVGVGSSRTNYLYMGYFGRALYNYKQKYLLSVSTRYDGSSNLGSDYKWGLFPGVSAGWNIHKEPFWEPMLHTVSQLKLRGSYGVNGNVNGIGAYQSQGSYSVGAVYGGVGAILNTALANPQLQWEQAKTVDLGIDFGFLDNRLAFTADVYRRITKNLISSRTLPQETGFGSILTNLGTVQNKGLDMQADFRAIPSGHALQWTISVNAAYVKNKIIKLPENGIKNNRIGGIYVWDEKSNSYDWKGGLQEGGTMGDLYGYQQLGLYQSDADAAQGPVDMIVDGSDKTKFGGDVIWKDADKNDSIDTRDQVYMGNIYPKWTGGLINTFSYKNFYFTVRMDFMTGHTIYDYMRATTTGQFAGDLGLSAEAGKSWLKPGDKTEIPRLYYGDYQENLARGNSIMFEKGNYLAIREVTFSYDLPSSVLQKMKISSLRFNVSAHNLHYFMNYKGINPENGGTDNGSYPLSSDIIFGATITL